MSTALHAARLLGLLCRDHVAALTIPARSSQDLDRPPVTGYGERPQVPAGDSERLLHTGGDLAPKGGLRLAPLRLVPVAIIVTAGLIARVGYRRARVRATVRANLMR